MVALDEKSRPTDKPAMDLLSVHETQGTPWVELAAKSEIHVGNLHNIAKGLRWFGPEAAIGLLKIGVDLNAQAAFYRARAAYRKQVFAKRQARSRKADESSSRRRKAS